MQALGVELQTRLLHLAQDAHDRQLDLLEQVGQPTTADLLPLPGGQRPDQQGVGAGLVLDLGREAALLAQLAERVRAAGGLEQVGGDLGVVRQRRRHLAERLGVVGDRPAARRAR